MVDTSYDDSSSCAVLAESIISVCWSRYDERTSSRVFIQQLGNDGVLLLGRFK